MPRPNVVVILSYDEEEKVQCAPKAAELGLCAEDFGDHAVYGRTDQDGKYAFDNLSPWSGSVTVTAKWDGESESVGPIEPAQGHVTAPDIVLKSHPLRWRDEDIGVIWRKCKQYIGCSIRGVTAVIEGGNAPFTWTLDAPSKQGWRLNGSGELTQENDSRSAKVGVSEARLACGDRPLKVTGACGQSIEREVTSNVGGWIPCMPSMGFGCGPGGATAKPPEYSFVNGHYVKTTYGCCNKKKYSSTFQCNTTYDAKRCSLTNAMPNAGCGDMCMSGFTAYEWTCESGNCIGEYCLPTELRGQTGP
jgi:hypothetical protein